jgi:hypothetical protein
MPALDELPDDALLRLAQIIGNRKTNPPIPAIIPVSPSTWWAGVGSGRYPKPTAYLGPKIPTWSVGTIRHLAKNGAAPDQQPVKAA